MEGKVPLTAFATVTDRTTPTTTTSAPPVAEPREASSSSSSSSVSFTFATPPAAQPISRRRQKRVLFEKGFSQQDWLRLTRAPRENLALAGLQGAEVDRLRDVLGRSGGRKIPLEEVARHKSEDDVWMALNGKVYNVTRYVKFHPGGVDWLMRGAGTDATKLFNKYHKWVNVDFMLQKTFLGFLDTTTLEIGIDNNGLTSLEGLQALSKLQILSASGNALDSCSGINQLAQLRVLDVSKNNIQYLTELKELCSLEIRFLTRDPA